MWGKLYLYLPRDYTILLVEGYKPLFGPLYSLPQQDLEDLKYWLDENLSKGFIQTSTSTTTTIIWLVKKGDSLLRLVINYRRINKGRIRNRYLLLLV
jgi:hypothetical protein